MIYEFYEFHLNTDTHELTRDGLVQKIEPQVFSLLRLLIENQHRLLTRRELIEQIWDGRAISDMALSCSIKNARKAIGDDGKNQTMIKTIHGKGFRFIAQAKRTDCFSPMSVINSDTESATQTTESVSLENGRPTVLVLPFTSQLATEHLPVLPDGFAQDIILGLSRLRWLKIIARASAFQVKDQLHAPEILIEKTGANYCLSGAIENRGNRLVLMIELTNLIDSSIIWMDRIECGLDDIHQLRSDVVNKVIATLEVQISAQEAKYAQLQSPENLDAWSSYHLALDHMYRFSEYDNQFATKLFQRAIKLEPRFARAHAGLSFTHFQSAFNRYTGIDIKASAIKARSSAERSVELDRFDPFANFVMGRSCWLDGRPEDCLPWVERAVEINPNYSHGYYVQGLAALMSNQADDSHNDASMAISISPLDPFLYAFYGLRVFSYIAQGNYRDAHIWAGRAASQPNAVPAMDLIALAACSLAESDEDSHYWASRARQRMQVIDKGYFFRALPFSEGKTREKIRLALAKYGF